MGLMTFIVILLGEAARNIGNAILGARVPARLIAEYLLYCAPQAAVWSFPFGTLLGVSMVVTGLSRHGETTAIRTAGVSFLRFCRPLFVVGLVASAAAFWLAETWAPVATRKSQDVFAQMTQTQPVVREEFDQFFRDPEGRFFFVRHMNADANTLEDITLWREDRWGRLVEYTSAKRAALAGRVWYLQNGVSVFFNEYGEPAPNGTQPFAVRPVVLQQALQSYYADKRTAFQMSTQELEDMARTREAGGQDTQRLRVDLQFKYSIPCACLVFAMMAAPLAFRYAHMGSYVGIVLAVLVIFLYNGVRSWALAFGLAGTIPPVVAGWTMNVLFGGWGLWLLARTR
jgi:lipopolysaccharide export system permease protein